jgi:hypothetical protein
MSRIEDLPDLRAHLQTAIEIEWSTVPPYLCALWSLGDVHNREAAACLRAVVMEEMLHLTLVANILNALGGEPRLGADQAPRYPTPLPHSDRSFTVSLLPFCPEALETFLRIERPALTGAPPQAEGYATIAQFYEAIEEGVERIGADPGVWCGEASRQVQPNREYYNGGGDAIAVGCRDSALKAIELIVDEGEGFKDTVFDGDLEILGEEQELAHYFRFEELARGRRYARRDTPSTGPTGPPVLLDYTEVAPMRPNPRPDGYPPGSELRALTEECDATYARLLAVLDAAFRGRPQLLAEAVREMWALEYQAVALMRVPAGEHGQTAGPAFTPPRG